MTNENIITAILGGSIILILIFAAITITIGVLYIIGLWKLFKKAGKNGWEALIPFYNTYVLIEIAGLNWWYFLIAISGTIFSILDIKVLNYITNIASLVVNFFVFYNIAKKMRKSPVGFGVVGIFVAPILIMILGMSKDYQYDNSVVVSPNGPIGDEKNNNTNQNTTPERYCLGCGQKLNSNDQYCQNCGKKVE
ncbi:MAG: DUF5684 domain-containing protein [Bacilli bacterium]